MRNFAIVALIAQSILLLLNMAVRTPSRTNIAINIIGATACVLIIIFGWGR